MGRRRDYLGWRIVWALSITTTISYGVLLYAFAVILPSMRHDLHASLGALSAAVEHLDRRDGPARAFRRRVARSPRRALVDGGGSLVAAASVVGWSQARNLPQLYLAFIGVGIASSAVLYDSAFAVIAVWFDRERTAALLTTTIVAGFASTIFLPLTQALIDAVGWRDALLVLAVMCGADRHPACAAHSPHAGRPGSRS